MKILFIQIGKTTDTHVTTLCQDYASRIKHYAPLTIHTIPAIQRTKALSPDKQKQLEAEEVLKLLQPTDYVVLLDERGKEYRSIEYASWLSAKMLSGTRRLVFIIGGPYGFSEKIYQRATEMISLSRLTFSHQLVRLFFLEQLYRAFTIIKGEPYHHE